MSALWNFYCSPINVLIRHFRDIRQYQMQERDIKINKRPLGIYIQSYFSFPIVDISLKLLTTCLCHFLCWFSIILLGHFKIQKKLHCSSSVQYRVCKRSCRTCLTNYSLMVTSVNGDGVSKIPNFHQILDLPRIYCTLYVSVFFILIVKEILSSIIVVTNKILNQIYVSTVTWWITFIVWRQDSGIFTHRVTHVKIMLCHLGIRQLKHMKYEKIVLNLTSKSH